VGPDGYPSAVAIQAAGMSGFPCGNPTCKEEPLIGSLLNEQLFSASGDHLRDITDAAPVLIWVSDATQKWSWFNRPWLEYTGRSLELEAGYGWMEGVHPDDRESCLAAYSLAFAEQKPFSLEHRLRRFDGEYAWLLNNGVPHFSPDGDFLGFIGACVDITLRKQAEEDRSRLAAIIKFSDDAILSRDLNGIITSWNRGAERLFGYSAAEALGQHVTMLIPPDRVDESPSVMERIRRGESVEHYETVRRCKDGTLLNISLTVSPIIDHLGKITGASKIMRDITFEKRSQESLRARTEELETLLDTLPAFIWICKDPQAQVITGNPAANNLTKTEAGTNISQTTLFPGSSGVYIRQLKEDGTEYRPEELPIQRAIATGQPVTDALLDFRFSDGRCVQAVGNAVPLLDKGGKPRGAIAAFLDITERKRAEEALIESRKVAEAANQSKDRFLAVLSHELRTPLTPVLMTLSALEHDPDLSTELRESLSMMKRNIGMEVTLIDDLLDLSRITSGKMELKREAVDLNALVHHAFGICQAQLLEKEINLDLDLCPNIGRISADPARLQQVIWNLLKNAVKFTRVGGNVRITTARLDNGHCELRVSDDGIGITPDALTRIFNAFEQGDPATTRQFGGLGLGLAISRALIDLHGGSIHAESEGKGKGATLIMHLPSDMLPDDSFQRKPVPDVLVKETLKLLVVEDHSDTALALKNLLTKSGYAVTMANNIATALSMAGTEKFDVVISDLGLPDGDGIEMISQLQKLQAIPAIAMSGFGRDEDIRRSRDAGFNAHLVKPVDFAQLKAAIAQVAKR